jgi:hypothetical protein
MRKFRVNVGIPYNAEIFRERYAKYIKSEHEVYYENTEFELQAPQEIYDEIDNLKEEMIEILED